MTILRIAQTIARGGLLASATLAAICLSRGAPAAGMPSESDDVPRVAVRYADLNLASQQDAKRLLARITDAAIQVCGDPASPLDLSGRARKRGCISAAVARAVEKVASEKLTMAYYQSQHAPRRGLPLSPRAASIAAAPGH